MKKLYIALGIVGLVSAVNNQISRSWFNPRSISFNPVLNQSQSTYNWLWNNEEDWNSLGIRAFAQSSTNDKELAAYFTPNDQTTVRLRENGIGDVNPAWYLLSTNNQALGGNYSSDVSFAPKRTAYGLIFDVKKRLSFNECMWVRVNTALVHSRNNLKVCEKKRNAKGVVNFPPKIKDACDAFSKPIVTHSQMQCCSVNKTGFDDIILRFGYDLFKSKRRKAAAWATMSLPTRSRENDQNLFSPVIGSDGVGFGGGAHWSQIISERGSCRTTLIGQLDLRYVLSTTQKRTFDLTANGNWSRYLIFAHINNGPRKSPNGDVTQGDSLLNLDAKVSPGVEFNWMSALHFTRKNWDFEVGFNAWYRDNESVKINNKKCPKDYQSYGILDVNTYVTSGGTIQSASKAKISDSFGQVAAIADPQFKKLTEADLNLCSVAHPRAASYTVYASGQRRFCDDQYVNLGLGYEFAQDQNSLEQFNFVLGYEWRF